MPIYTIEADDGRRVKIEADNEQNAMSTFDEWYASNKPQGMSEKASNFALGRLEASKQGAIASVPGVASFRAFTNPDTSGIDKASAIAGDIGGAALLATPGGIANKLGVGAGLGAALESSGINPAARMAADKIANIYEPQTRNVALNAALMVPQTLAASAVEALPSFAAGKAIGKAGRAKIPPVTALLEKSGGTPPPSAYATGKIGGTLTRGVERLARTNPLTEGMLSDIDTKNANAVKGYVEKNAPGSMEATGYSGGEKITGAMEKANSAKQAQYDSIMQEVKGLKGGEKNPGRPIAAKLDAILKTEDFIPKESIKLIKQTAADLRKVETPGQYDAVIKKFNFENQKLLAEYGEAPGVQGSLNHYFGMANDIIKQGHYDNLNKIQKGLGDRLRATNFDYATAKGELFGPFAKMAGGKVEDLPKKILTSGQDFQSAAKEHLGKEGYRALQDEALNEMIRQSKDAQGNLNAKSLENLYNKKYRGMDWRPEQKMPLKTPSA